MATSNRPIRDPGNPPQHMRPDPNDRGEEATARAMKALGIVARIQAEVDPAEWERHWGAAAHIGRPANRRMLEPYTTHCRQFPSNRTWAQVVAFGRMYAVTKI